jgi:hypothetical protein
MLTGVNADAFPPPQSCRRHAIGLTGGRSAYAAGAIRLGRLQRL